MTNINAVAKRAGVSASTVSRVISNKSYVKEKTRQRVLKAVEELNYIPNVLAKGLKMGTTNTIALMVPSIQNQIFPIVARGVEDMARKNGFTVILCNTDEDIAVEKDYINKLRNRWVDGFIVSSMMPNSDHIYKLQEEGFPVVLTARYNDDRISAVVIDNYQAAYDAVCHLVKTGHKKIAIALGRINLPIYQMRFDGYKDALEHNGINLDEKLIINDTNGDSGFYHSTINLLKTGIRPDAIFATSDPKAIVVVRAITDFGLKIPEDISVLGFDNIEMSSLMEPPLSTVSQPLYEIGELAAKKLIDMIRGNGPAVPTVDVMRTDLIIRKSTR